MNKNLYKKYLQLSDKVPELLYEELDSKIIKILTFANKELQRHYDGKYRFQLCEEKEGIPVDKLKITPKKKRIIKEKWLEFNSEISRIQRLYEKYLQNSIEEKSMP